MNLFNLNIENKDEYYNHAIEYFNKITVEDHNCGNFDNIVPKSISILIHHDFIPAPCVEIKLDILQNKKRLGTIFYISASKRNLSMSFLFFNKFLFVVNLEKKGIFNLSV